MKDQGRHTLQASAEMTHVAIPDGTSYCCSRNDQSVATGEDEYRSRQVGSEHRVGNPFATIGGGWDWKKVGVGSGGVNSRQTLLSLCGNR